MMIVSKFFDSTAVVRAAAVTIAAIVMSASHNWTLMGASAPPQV